MKIPHESRAGLPTGVKRRTRFGDEGGFDSRRVVLVPRELRPPLGELSDHRRARGFDWRLALGSLAAARRTQSSYNTFLTSTNPSDLAMTIDAPNISSDLARLKYVRHVGVSTYSVNAFPAGKHGLPAFPAAILNGT